MGMMVKGIKLSGITIDPTAEGKGRIIGSYSLISDMDKVLAKQSFNEYGGMEINFSTETIKAMNDLFKSLKQDVNSTLGIEEKE